MPYVLDDRLALVASMVRKGKRVADVGCDHAYLPIYLIKNKIASFVIASDVRTGPLESAQRNIAAEGLCEQVTTVLSNGLDNINGSDFDDLTVCGLGGILMCDILSRADFLKDKNKRLVLQPMTDTEIVREWLYVNGFEIISERAARAAGHIYSVINAVYTGKIRKPDILERHLGGIITDPTDTEKEYIEKYLNTLRSRLSGKIKAKNLDKSELKELNELILQIEKVKEEL